MWQFIASLKQKKSWKLAFLWQKNVDIKMFHFNEFDFQNCTIIVGNNKYNYDI